MNPPANFYRKDIAQSAKFNFNSLSALPKADFTNY